MLILHELAPSPNNVKVRMALRYKGIPFEALAIDPLDRAPVVALSGQEGTPVVEDRGIVLNDSDAILFYLDANYPDTPRLYPRTREGRRACDRWRDELERTIGPPWAEIFFTCIKRRESYDPKRREEYASVLAEYEARLDGKTTFHADPEMVVCDLRVAEFAVYGLPGEGLVERCRLFAKFRQEYGVDPARFPALTKMLERWNAWLA